MKFMTLSRMPGNTKGFVDFILNFIRYINGQQVVSRAQATQWFAQHSMVGTRFVANCTQLLLRLEIIAADGDEAWFVGDFGQQLLDAPQGTHYKLMATWLLQNVVGMQEVLHIVATAGSKGLRLQEVDEALKPYYSDKSPVPNAQDRTDYLRACRCLQSVGRSGLRITPLGRDLATSFPPEPGVEVTVVPAPFTRQLVPMADALERDGRDSEHPERFEETLRACFDTLGFRVFKRGSPGDTDILVVAPLGIERFSFIVDAKTNRHGRIRDLNAPNIKKHRERYAADYALIVAPDYERGESVLEQAENYQIVLMTTAVLRQLLELHTTTPQNLRCYQALFERSGILDELPRAILAMAEQRNRAFDLALDVFETLSAIDLRGPIPAQEIEWVLLGKLGTRPTPEEARQALQLLAHPAIGAVHMDGDHTVSVTMNRTTLQATLQQLALRVCDAPRRPPREDDGDTL